MILNFANWFRIIKLVILISDPLPLAKKDWVRMKLDDQKLQTMPTLSFLLGRSLSGFWPSAFCFGHFTFFGVDFSSFHFLPESSTYASVWNINVISWPTYRSNRWNSDGLDKIGVELNLVWFRELASCFVSNSRTWTWLNLFKFNANFNKP